MADETLTLSEDKIAASKTDPGACRNGNFINYYQFHSAQERVDQLPHDVWHSNSPRYLGLDVGCNTGVLTTKLYDFLKENLPTAIEVSLLGVDLDPILILRAEEQNVHVDRISYKHLDFMSAERDAALNEYLLKEEGNHFDVAFCFSITMWIHLNYGDEGLRRFIQSVCEKCIMVVIEPQPWKCYRNAARRLRRAEAGDYPFLDSLKLKGNMEEHVEKILEDSCGFKKVAKSGNNDWGRRLLIYKRS